MKKLLNANLRTIITIVFVISLISIVSIGAYSVTNSIAMQTENIEVNTISHLKTSDAVLFEKIKSVQRFVDILAVNKELSGRISTYTESNFAYVTSELGEIIHDYEDIEGCVMVNSSGDAFIYNVPDLKEENLLRLQVSCQGLSDKIGYLKWYNINKTETDTSVFDRYVFCATKIYRDLPVKLYIFINKDAFASVFDSSPYQSFVGVLDEFGRIVVSNDNDKFSEIYYSNGQNTIETYNSQQGIYTFSAKGKDYVAVHYQSLLNEFKFVEIYPESTFYNSCYRIIPFICFIILFVLGIMSVLYYVLFNRFLRPFKKLCYSMENFSDSTLDSHLEVLGNAEISMLTSGINMMISKINMIVEDIKNKEKEKKEAELLALKSQIRPHFIYNIINSIKILAMYNNQKQITDALNNLSQLLKISFASADTYVPLKQDMEFIKGYVELMQICYENAINSSYCIETGAEECIIPNMLIQPIVENAIRHGLAPKIAEGKMNTSLYISAGKTDDKLTIEVTDNGNGMPKEQIEAIYKGENISRGRGVGLKNIIERLELLYGSSYGFTIDSKENYHTTIRITLPLENED